MGPLRRPYTGCRSRPQRVSVAPLLALALTLVSAVAYAAAFPTAAVRPLAFVALAPLFVALARVGPRGAAGLGALWTVLAAYRLNDWFPRAVANYYEQPILVGFGFFFGVSLLTAAPGIVAFGICYRRLAAVGGAGAALLVGAGWVAAEWLRATVTADPWALLGYSQAGVHSLVQVADLGGVYAVSFVLAVANAAAAQLVSGRSPSQRSPAGAVAAAGALLGATLSYGQLQPEIAPRSATAPVAIAQANLDLGTQWRQASYGRNLDLYLRLTERVLASHRAALVVWPESAMSFFIDSEPAYRAAISRVLAPGGAQVLAGGPHQDPLVATPRYFNAAFLIAPDGQPIGRYDKQQLLPFAEYFPLPALDFLRREFGRVREFSSGMPGPPLPTALGLAGVTICNEALFSAPARERVRAGATFLVNLANDGWLGDAKYSEQALEMVTFRAVEQRRWLVRASTSGPSALISPWGRVVARTSLFAEETLVGAIAAREDQTLYARVGDAFAGLCALVVLAYLVATRRRAAVSWRD